MAIAAPRPQPPERFLALVEQVTAAIAGHKLDDALSRRLAQQFPPGGDWFTGMEASCRQGRDEGWLCAREQDGIRFGRPVKPGPRSSGFSVDVVEMDSLTGPFHAHPNGEIDMVMPLSPYARFDGSGRGWMVYQPGSAHHPTVAGGRALILYLLPDGAIDFQARGATSTG